MEDGITDDASVAARTVLVVAKGRNEAAASQLKSVKGELEALQKEYDSLVCERDVAKRRAEEAISASKEFEKAVEELTLELIATRESLESAHAAHLEAEEHRIGATLAKDQDCLHWEKEINQAEEELHMLNEQLLHSKDLKTKLETASAMLIDLKKELAVYMESQLKEKSESVEEVDPKNDLHESEGLRLALVSKRKELEELRANIDKVNNDVSILRSSKSSLKSEVDTEKASLASIRQREGMASIAVSSLEAEIERKKEEIKQTILKEKEAREKVIQLPKLLQQAAIEADRFKSSAKMAQEELRTVEEQAEQAKGSLSTTEIRIQATSKEIEASKASEVLSLATLNALQESEEAAALGESPRGVTLPLEEYYILSERAHEAEELANEIISSAIVQIDVAKESEMMTLQRLDKAYMELDQRKEALRIAKDKAEKAKERKLGVEQELRKWRAEHEQRRRASDGAQNAVISPRSSTKSLDDSREAKFFSQEAIVVAGPKIYMSVNKTENVVPEVKPRKKKSFFPRLLMFFVRKKKQSQK
ncbi:hypothetical protein HPP92_018684 [Vanilla planifolia]|uniref:Uncharacterized protein n=1 Tax=Vanilla planifolia TaxID=51239 RepID=A0A835QA95_VANPL|nr:hypothetical protein HPP92_018684 [Vanilla planifolia]